MGMNTLSWTWGKPTFREIVSHAGKSLVLELIAWRYRKMADVLKLHYSADNVCRTNGLPTLALEYVGPGEREQDAREELKEIQSVFNVLLDHGSPEHSFASTIKPDTGILQGKGRVLGQPFWVSLRVPWLPPGCEVELSTKTLFKAVCLVE